MKENVIKENKVQDTLSLIEYLFFPISHAFKIIFKEAQNFYFRTQELEIILPILVALFVNRISLRTTKSTNQTIDDH